VLNRTNGPPRSLFGGTFMEGYLLGVIVILASMDQWLGVIWLVLLWCLGRYIVGTPL
jgi:hypothetical protein